MWGVAFPTFHWSTEPAVTANQSDLKQVHCPSLWRQLVPKSQNGVRVVASQPRLKYTAVLHVHEALPVNSLLYNCIATISMKLILLLVYTKCCTCRLSSAQRTKPQTKKLCENTVKSIQHKSKNTAPFWSVVMVQFSVQSSQMSDVFPQTSL